MLAQLGKDQSHASGQLLDVRDMQELVGAMSVGLGTKDSCDNELGLREHCREETHQWNASTFTHSELWPTKYFLYRRVDDIGKELAMRWDDPTSSTSCDRESCFCSIRNVCG